MTRARTPSVGHRLGSVVLVVVCLSFLVPLLLMTVTALRSAADVARHPLGLPAHVTLSTLRDAARQVHLEHSLVNTGLVAVVSCGLVTGLAAMASYPLGRLTAAWSTLAYRLFALGALLPIFAVLAPLYVLLRDLHLLDNRVGLVLVYTAVNLPVAVFCYTTFVRTIPAELDDAAACDGCGVVRTFVSVVLPLLRPVTGVMVLFVSLQVWNDLVAPLVFLGDPGKRTLMANAFALVDPYHLDPTLLCAAALLGFAPLLVVFLLVRRHVVDRVAAAAVTA
ncbi:hypothetical protein acdb102_24960 [Acidothermaceae bacterium B102]|nr:hypothetical protein acdb102_24960 [Acidothermaceae bacterium B102]